MQIQDGLGSSQDQDVRSRLGKLLRCNGINRAGKSVFEGETSTKNLNRTLADMVDYLGRCKPFPNGVFLFSGTGVVPPDTFTLAADDEVRIKIDPIGELVNKVVIVGGKK